MGRTVSRVPPLGKEELELWEGGGEMRTAHLDDRGEDLDRALYSFSPSQSPRVGLRHLDTQRP